MIGDLDNLTCTQIFGSSRPSGPEPAKISAPPSGGACIQCRQRDWEGPEPAKISAPPSGGACIQCRQRDWEGPEPAKISAPPSGPGEEILVAYP